MASFSKEEQRTMRYGALIDLNQQTKRRSRCLVNDVIRLKPCPKR
jgi:hypothetical protein